MALGRGRSLNPVGRSTQRHGTGSRYSGKFKLFSSIPVHRALRVLSAHRAQSVCNPIVTYTFRIFVSLAAAFCRPSRSCFVRYSFFKFLPSSSPLPSPVAFSRFHLAVGFVLAVELFSIASLFSFRASFPPLLSTEYRSMIFGFIFRCLCVCLLVRTRFVCFHFNSGALRANSVFFCFVS